MSKKQITIEQLKELYKNNIHWAAELFQPPEEKAYTAFKESIEGGLQTPIVLYKDKEERLWILDGRTRARAILELHYEGKAVEVFVTIISEAEEPDPLEYVLKANEHRRDSTPSDKSISAAKLAWRSRQADSHGEDKDKDEKSIESACERFPGAKKRAAYLMLGVYKREIPELIRVVESRCLPVYRADALIRKPGITDDEIRNVATAGNHLNNPAKQRRAVKEACDAVVPHKPKAETNGNGRATQPQNGKRADGPPSTDIEGTPIPEELRSLFKDAYELVQPFISHIEQLRLELENCMKQPELPGAKQQPYFLPVDILKDLALVLTQLIQHTPYLVCDHCHGEGTIEATRCPGCHGLGWKNRNGGNARLRRRSARKEKNVTPKQSSKPSPMSNGSRRAQR